MPPGVLPGALPALPADPVATVTVKQMDHTRHRGEMQPVAGLKGVTLAKYRHHSAGAGAGHHMGL